MFKKVHSRIPVAEVNGWSDEKFLSKCGLMIDGKLTRAAIIFLGKSFSEYLLRPAVVQETWTLRDKNKDVIDYEHFSVPYILTVDEILAKIHNLTLREMPGGTLFPDTMKQYDDYPSARHFTTASPTPITSSSSVSTSLRIPVFFTTPMPVRSSQGHWKRF